jgi:hypothetical protein
MGVATAEKHTPAPWTLKMNKGEVYTDHGSDWLFGPDGEPIIHFHQEDYDSEAWYSFKDADAILISKAPNLLTGLKHLINYAEKLELALGMTDRNITLNDYRELIEIIEGKGQK